MQSHPELGCDRCWPASADAAWEARRALRHVAELVDESHLHAMILACPECGQRFLSVFAETVDWADSEDPQCWTLLPVTEPEAGSLLQQGNPVSEDQLSVLAPGRRFLRRDCPKGAPPRVSWATGNVVGPHD